MVHFSQCCWSLMFIPDPNFFHPRSRIRYQKDSRSRIRIRIKEFKYFNPMFLNPWKYDPGCSSRIRILIFYPPRIQGLKRHRIRNTGFRHECLRVYFSTLLLPKYSGLAAGQPTCLPAVPDQHCGGRWGWWFWPGGLWACFLRALSQREPTASLFLDPAITYIII